MQNNPFSAVPSPFSAKFGIAYILSSPTTSGSNEAKMFAIASIKFCILSNL